MQNGQLENKKSLFSRFRGRLVNIKTLSGGIYEGRVADVTQEYISLLEAENTEPTEVFIRINAIESIVAVDVPKA